SEKPTISADGRYIAFQSYADNLVDEEVSDRTYDLYVFDREEKEMERIELNHADRNNPVDAEISPDGRYILVESPHDLAGDQTYERNNYFLYDRQEKTFERV